MTNHLYTDTYQQRVGKKRGDMKRSVILLLTIIINLALGLYFLVPGIVTYAEIVPPSVNCSACSKPEVQQALQAAVSYGRHQVLSFYDHGTWIVLLLCAANIAFVAAILFWPVFPQAGRVGPGTR